MATEREIILKVEVDNRKAIPQIVEMTKELDGLKKERQELKESMKNEANQTEENYQKLVTLDTQIRETSKGIKELTSAVDANIKEQDAQEGSLVQMRAQLKQLVYEYDNMSAAVRDSDFGASKAKDIADLRQNLKDLEGNIGDFRRNVGDYRNAINDALNGNASLKSAFGELRNELTKITFQQRQQVDAIKEQKAALDELARTVGTDSQAYKESEAELQRMQDEYKETTQTIQEMTKAGSDMKDAIGDVNRALSEGATDNSTLVAIGKGVQVAADSYAALKAGMTALGIESENLMNVFAKLQIIQQGLNSVTRIFNALQKESLLRQKLTAAWTTLTTTSIATLTAAKKKDAAASVEAAAGDAALAAGETAATAAAGGLTVALHAVSTAIKSIPLIGWLLAAVAALGTVVGFIVKANKESKKGNDELERRRQLEGEIHEMNKEALENTQKQVVQMEQNVKHLEDMKEGTQEWDDMVTQVADDLGVDAAWLKKNTNKVGELTKAWIKLQQSMALGEAAAKKMADNQIKQATAATDIMRIMQGTDAKKRTEELQKQLGITEKQAQKISKAYHKFGGNSKEYQNAVKGYMNTLKTEQKAIEDVQKKAYDDQMKAQEDLKTTAEGHIKTTSEKAHKAAKSAQKDIKDLGEQFEDLLVEGMVDGIEKQIKEVERAADKWIKKMEEARDKDLKNADIYNDMILEKERQTQEKVKKIRQTEYARVAGEVKKLKEEYDKLWDDSASSSLGKHISALDKITKKLSEDIDNMNLSIQELNNSSAKIRFSDMYSAEVDKLALKFDDEETHKQVVEYLKKTYKLKPKEAEKIASNISSEIRKGFKSVKDSNFDIKIGASDVSVNKFINDFSNKMKKIYISSNFVNMTTTRDIYNALDKESEDLKKKREEMAREAAKSYQKTIGDEQKALMIENERAKVYAEIAKDAQEAAEAQGEMGKLFEVPEDLTTYIDYKIEELKKERAILKDDISDANKRNEQNVKQQNKKELGAEINNPNRVQFYTETEKEREIERLDEIEEELNELYEKKKKISEQSLIESKETTIEYGTSAFNAEQIDYYKNSIKDVEKEMENLKQQKKDMEKALSDGVVPKEEVKQTYINISKIEADLEELAEKKKNLAKWARLAEEGLGFFDNPELLKEELEIEKLQGKVKALNLVKQRGIEIQKQIDEKESEYNKWLKTNQIEIKNLEQELVILYNLKKRGANVDDKIAEKEKRLSDLRAETSQRNQDLRKDELDQLRQQLAEIGFTSEEDLNKLIELYQRKIGEHVKTTEKLMKTTAANVLSAFATVTNAIEGMFQEIGEDNAEMANFLEALAYINIGVNLAAAIAGAVEAGSNAGPFPYNLAAIAAGIAAVVGAIGSAISTYKKYHQQVTSPKFASGGVIGGREARSKSEGRKDDVNIWASRGEYIINAERVKEYGVGFFDQINFGKKLRKINLSGNYADGGVVSQTTIQQVATNSQSFDMLVNALQQMPAPEVSVMEISNKQKRVQVKERIAKNK